MLMPLPIAPADALASIIRPALALLPPALSSPRAAVLLLAIALQESGLAAREQRGGPARGLWQFEQGGIGMCTLSGASCWGVLEHPTTAPMVRSLCAVRGVPATSYSIHASVAGDDVLAAGIARLLLYADAAPLPCAGDTGPAWAYYLRNWRPGKPRPETWGRNYTAALAAMQAAA